MTLCIMWKQDNIVHFASDSRVTTLSNSYADVAIKVLSVPFKISVFTTFNKPSKLYSVGELGMCFAGSSINSLFLKESLIETLKYLDVTPNYSEQYFKNLIPILFKQYSDISKSICKTALGEKGRAEIFLSGSMEEDNGDLITYKFSTDSENKSSSEEVLKNNDEYLLSGTGSIQAEKLLSKIKSPSTNDYLSVLMAIINDDNFDDVGGEVQYGTFVNGEFIIYQVVEKLLSSFKATSYYSDSEGFSFYRPVYVMNFP